MTLLEIQRSKPIFSSFILTLMVLMLTGYLAIGQGRRNLAAEQRVLHKHEVLGELNTTLSLMQDVETDFRGYAPVQLVVLDLSNL